MAIRTKEQLLESIKNRVGDDTSDETISFIEDINDTFTDYERRLAETGDWKTKFEENDKSWRERYKERFFNPELADKLSNEDMEEIEEDKKLSFDDLFKEEK